MDKLNIQDESLLQSLGYSTQEIDSLNLYNQTASLGLIMMNLSLSILLLSILIKFTFGIVMSPITLVLSASVFIIFHIKQNKILHRK